MVYSAKQREYQLVAKSTNSAFFKSCYFHNVDIFHCGMPPELEGTQRKILGHAKKIVPPNFETVSAPI